MPSRVRHTGADFTPAKSSHTCIFLRKIRLKRLILPVGLGAVCSLWPAIARTQTAPEAAPLPAAPPIVKPTAPIEITVQGEVAPNAGSKLREPLRDEVKCIHGGRDRAVALLSARW